MGLGTSLSRVTCFCNHLTSFGSEFFVPPNTIDFGSAFSDLGGKLADNYFVLLTICLLFGLYIVVAIWARYKDKQDVKKVRGHAISLFIYEKYQYKCIRYYATIFEFKWKKHLRIFVNLTSY